MKLFAAAILAVTALAFVAAAPKLRLSLVSAPAHPVAGRPVSIIVRATRGGERVRRARVAVWIARNRVRRSFAARAEAKGRYRARVVFPSAGTWAFGARAGAARVKFGSIRAGRAAVPLKFAWPTSIDVVSSRSLLLVENGAGRLLRIDPVTGDSTPVIASIPQAYAVAHGATGSIYLSAAKALLRIDGGKATAVASADEQIGPVAIGPAGDVYYTTATRVFRVSAGGGSPVRIAGTGVAGYGGDGGPATAAQISGPHGLAVTGDGAVLICDTGNGRIRRIDPATGIITTIARLDEPRGIDIAEGGSIYVVDAANGRIVHLAADGRRFGVVGPMIADPYDVEVASRGVVYVIDTNAAGRLYRIAPDGTYRIVSRGG